jgi:hypothetical protein
MRVNFFLRDQKSLETTDATVNQYTVVVSEARLSKQRESDPPDSCSEHSHSIKGSLT